MSIPGFGNVVPIHFSILSLAGWELETTGSRLLQDDSERLAEMRRGHEELVTRTGVDFGFDLAAWRELLLTCEEFNYRHPYAFDAVDQAVRDAIGDPMFARLRGLAEGAQSEGSAKAG